MPFYQDHLNVDDPDEIHIPLMGIAVADTSYTHPMHQHKKGQLLYCNQGIVEVLTEELYFLLSPARAVWVPANTLHRIKARTKFSFQSLYFDVLSFSQLPNNVTILQVTSLLRELIAKACSYNFSYTEKSPEFRLGQVIADEISYADSDIFSIVRPNDQRLKKAFSHLKKFPSLQTTADDIAQLICTTPRTLSRLCNKELGMSFEQWRAQIMMMESLVMLEKGKTLGFISDKLGYGSESAFIYRFRQWIGTTPFAYKNDINKHE